MSEVELSRKWDQCLQDVVDKYWFWIRDCFLTSLKKECKVVFAGTNWKLEFTPSIFPGYRE